MRSCLASPPKGTELGGPSQRLYCSRPTSCSFILSFEYQPLIIHVVLHVQAHLFATCHAATALAPAPAPPVNEIWTGLYMAGCCVWCSPPMCVALSLAEVAQFACALCPAAACSWRHREHARPTAWIGFCSSTIDGRHASNADAGELACEQDFPGPRSACVHIRACP